MKKLTALLFACMMMTCTFTACGKKSGSTSDTKKNTSTSETTTDDDETEPTINKKKTSTTEAEEKTSKETEEKSSEDDTEDSTFVGKWELIMGIEEDGTILEEDPEGEFENYREYRLEAYSDGTGYVDYFGEKQDFEWKKKDENIIEIFNNEDMVLPVFIINSSSITISEAESFMIFEKVKKFSDTDKPAKNGNKIESEIIGKWEVVKVGGIINGEIEVIEGVDDYDNEPLDSKWIEFNSDGTASIGYNNEIQYVKWKKKGEYAIEVYTDENNYDDDGKLVYSEIELGAMAVIGGSMINFEDGEVLILEKVK